MNTSRKSDVRSPFFSRAYGGFTNAQVSFYRDIMGDPFGQVIFDPMAGQAFSMSALAHAGANVWVGDIDPAPLLLASLRDPALIRNAAEYFAWFTGILAKLSRRSPQKRAANRFYDGWVAAGIRSDLYKLAELVGLDMFSNPFDSASAFWAESHLQRFAAGIVVLAARELACYRATDNVTWLKPGGLIRYNRAVSPLKLALQRWQQYAIAATESMADNAGKIVPRLMNIVTDNCRALPKFPRIITSPPYANRLDYTRLWGPELNVLAALCNGSPDGIKAAQIGSTVVEGTVVSDDQLAAIPQTIQDVLNEIRRDPADYSDVYYFPFFRNYAVSLHSALLNMASKLRTGGTLVLFVRDTTRKDTLFPTGAFVREVLTSKPCLLREVRAEKHVIRGHVGYLRRASIRGVYGLAQQEWWLAFDKPRAIKR